MLLTTTLLVFSAAAAETAPADPAAAFRVPACSTSAPAGWTSFDDPWLKGRAPEAWSVKDALTRWEPVSSTATFKRVLVDVDASGKSSAKPALSVFGMVAEGKTPGPGAWLDESLAYADVRGDFALGKAGTVTVPGRGECALGVVEHNARRACAGAPEAVCRRATLHLDCGVKGGVQLLVTATTPGYPARGTPDGKAADALAQIKSFLCTLEYRK